MRTNVTGRGAVGKAEEFLLEKLGYEVSVFDPHIFPSITTSKTKIDLSFLCTPRDFVVDAVKNARLVSNDFLCVLITFLNKADYLIKRLELNNIEVARLVCADARLPMYGTSRFGQPYRGKLVPTFTDELINAFCREVLNPMLFEAIRTYNLRIEKRHANT